MKKLLYLQTAVLLFGVVVSWTTVVGQLQEFYSIYGTVFHFENCIIPNPLKTPCFYGAIAFLIAFVWSFTLTIKFNEKSQKWLLKLLTFCIGFAASVLTYEFMEYYRYIPKTGVSCAPGVFPLKTACFAGFLSFLVSGLLAKKIIKLKNEEDHSC